jgi:hypothetical protein
MSKRKTKTKTNIIVMKMKNRILILILPLLLLSSAGAFADSNDIDINTAESGTGSGFRWDGTKLIIGESGTYIITGTGDETSNCIEVNGVMDVNITIKNVNIYIYGCAFRLLDGAEVNLMLSGENFLTSTAVFSAGLEAPSGTSLTINGELLEDKLTAMAVGSAHGAGIGGGFRVDGGDITITGGTVEAYSYYGAGIGGGDEAAGGVITITGGTVKANSNFSAGIGGGYYDPDASVCTIEISGGTVEVYSYSGAGIGGGSASSFSGSIIITGGTVEATSSDGAGIGGGSTSGSFSGSIIISGGTIKAAGGSNGNIQSQPTDGEGNNVYLNTLTVGSDSNSGKSISAGSINGKNCDEIPDAEIGVYGIKDMKTDSEGIVYLYLPESGEKKQVVTLTVKDGSSYQKSYKREDDAENVQTLVIPDATLKNLQIDGEEVPGFDPGNTNYQLTVPCSTEQVTISGETNDAAASLDPPSGTTCPLKAGNNSFTLTVMAADDITTKVYTVTVIRDCPAPKILKDLEDAIICVGESHTFEIVAEGDNLSYEWYYGNERIKGVNGNTYTITNAELRDYERYYVIVRSQIGDYRSSIYSKNVRLWVADQLPESLRFVEFPSTVTTGNTYRIKLAGYPDVTQYVWGYDRDGVTFSPETGGIGDNETLATFGVLSEGLGTLTATLTHPCGTREATQTIRVNYPTGIEEVTVNEIAVSPNPTQGIIKVSGTRSNQIVRIVDITGSLKGTYPTQDSETTIDLTGYSKGTYLIQYGGKTVKVVKK